MVTSVKWAMSPPSTKMLTTAPIPFSGGVHQEVIPFRAQEKGFYKLEEFRHSRTQYGLLEQCSPFRLLDQFDRGTYWDSSSKTEPTTSAVRFSLNVSGPFITDYCLWSTSWTQMQVFHQTTFPVAESIYTGCRLVVNSVSGLNLTLGNTLDVEMTGAAAFRWRKNGGAWTAGVPSTAGVSIDGGNATLYFLASSGFAGTEAWAWTRTDRQYSNTVYMYAQPIDWCFYRNELYFCSTDSRLMLVTTGGADEYCITLGYRPVYGTTLTVFEDHLIVGNFSKTAIYATDNTQTVGWSDLNDLHNFIPTDTNEADSYRIEGNPTVDGLGTYAQAKILGLAVVQQTLFIVALNGIHSTAYLGLPLVFSFKKHMVFQTALTYRPVIPAVGGVYIVAYNDVFFFDGVNLTSIGKSVSNIISGNFSASYGAFDRVNQELFLIRGKTALCYQAKYGEWYTRSVDFSNDSLPVTSVCANDGVILGSTSRKRYTEGTFDPVAPAYNATNGTAYAVPKVTTQLFGENLRSVKEISSVFLGAFVTTQNSTYYSTDANVQFQVHWYNSGVGIITGTPSTSANARWVNTASDGMISLPRISFRSLAIEIQVVGLVANKPPAQATITAIEPLYYIARDAER